MPKKLLYVVHRYAPYPGGSEYNVQRLAEESVRQGHDVTVLAATNQGDLNGVRVTSDHDIVFKETFDLAFIHGSCQSQDFVHWHAQAINQRFPTYYLIVEPPKPGVAYNHILSHRWVAWGTSMDKAFIEHRHVPTEKITQFIYGIGNSYGNNGFKERYQLPQDQKLYVSAGGFWPHKRHSQLADAFRIAKPENTHLVLLGYDNQHGSLPSQSENVSVIMDASQQDVYDAMFEADLYVLNSESEGYGLVLLEAMQNCTPWIATDIAAAHDLAEDGWGVTYSSQDELIDLLRQPPDAWNVPILDMVERRTLVQTKHSIENSVHSILSVLD